MGANPPTSVEELLRRWRGGDGAALGELLPLVYAELRRLAHHYLAAERPSHTLQSAALVNEAYLRLVEDRPTGLDTRSQFFGIAARLMRQILVDHARRRGADKRNGGRFVTLDDSAELPIELDLDLVALDDALTELAKLDEQQTRIVELRFFVGLSIDETSRVMQVSPATVKRSWTAARLWLQRELTRERLT